MDLYDIAVIGAGPAGIMAATHSVSEKRRVCLIDRKEKPGYPVRCGEAIGLKGFSASVKIRKEWIKSRIKTMKLVSPSGISISVPNSYEGYVLDREIMERDLINEAVSKGVYFLPKTTVTSVVYSENGIYKCKTKNGEIFTKCVILAEGVESRLARSLGWVTNLDLKDIHCCAFARVIHPNIEPETCYFYIGSSYAPGGYIWVFHRGEDCANVGLGVLGSKTKAGLPKQLLLDFINKKFPGAKISELHFGGVPMSKWKKPLVNKGVMLVGDCARMVNCVSGAGIAYALFSGKTAGEVAAKSFIGNECKYEYLKEYEKKWNSFYGKQQIRSYSLKETMVNFDDNFIEKIASEIDLKIKKNKNINILSIFIKAFSLRPLMLLKVIKLLK